MYFTAYNACMLKCFTSKHFSRIDFFIQLLYQFYEQMKHIKPFA